jgi:elongation factor Tu
VQPSNHEPFYADAGDVFEAKKVARAYLVSRTDGAQGRRSVRRYDVTAFSFRDLMFTDRCGPLNVRANVMLLPENRRGRRSDSEVHWRPNHNFGSPDGRDFYIGQVEFETTDTLEPGQTCTALVRFLDGPGLSENLVPGRSWRIQEGPTLVARATVIEVVGEI